MEALAIVTSLALIQVVFFSYQVGVQRQKHGVSAPSMSGPDDYLRQHRVHMNTIEQLIVFIPALWMFGYYVNPLWGSGLGLIFVISRFMYSSAYISEPEKRGMPFTVGLLTIAVLVVGSMIGAVMSWMAQH